LPPELHDYVVRHTVRETDLQRRLRQETRSTFDAEMQIAPEQAQFFRFLVRALGVRRALEVGTFTGYSALAVAMELPPDGSLDCCDVSEEFTAMARRYWEEAGVADRIRLHIGPGAETLGRLLREGGPGQYDFAFIDADKTGYPGYFRQCLELVRPGGVVCFDNTLWSGRVAAPGPYDGETAAILELNDMVVSCPGAVSCLLPVGDGLTMAWLSAT
jgi:predicted O-methyltransferase YrrM